MNNDNALPFDKDLVEASDLNDTDKNILINIGFPYGENIPITYDDYEPDFNVIKDTLFENKGIVSIAKDKWTDTYLVIATSNHALYLYGHDRKFTFINSSLSLFLSFQTICQHFFANNPEFNDEKYTNDKDGLHKIDKLKKELIALDKKAFGDENSPWSFFIEELTYI